mgnify:CR=1 FL=1
MHRDTKKKAQSTLEYILVITAIVGVIIWAAGSKINPAVEQALKDANTAIGKAADKIAPPVTKTQTTGGGT